ncbi:MBG domain-containing protein [Pediococcus inopinatus]|uniref:MBG domain-containing protein n=2 Tax=Pediococcus inopinatus TaxID=114090 RepID=UPI002B26245D|nr:MBG domain-containing protein [Pediococcus inopinatus]WPC16934.1 MBG domain-containing protein [Pediococcus inopinatus]
MKADTNSNASSETISIDSAANTSSDASITDQASSSSTADVNKSGPSSETSIVDASSASAVNSGETSNAATNSEEKVSSSSASTKATSVASGTNSSQSSSMVSSAVSSVDSSATSGSSTEGSAEGKTISTSEATNSNATSASKVNESTTTNSDALATLKNKLPADSVVTTKKDGTVVIALAVGADETAVKALVAKANLNLPVVIEAKDANVVVPNLNNVTNINKAGEKYTGTSSTVAQDFTAAGTATAELSVVAPKVPGYVFQGPVSSTVMVGSSNVNLVYNKQTAAVTVHYQDYAGNTISKDATLTGSYGDAKINGTTTTNPAVPTIAGYTFTATDSKNLPATVVNFTALDANGNVFATDVDGKTITSITLYYKTNATVTLSGTETEVYTGVQQTPKATNYKITLPTGVTYALKDSDIQLASGGINVGSYNVKLSPTGLSNITTAIGTNYAITFGTATGSFIIKAADTKVTLSGTETEMYNGAQQTPKASNFKITLPTGVTYTLKDSDVQVASGGINIGTYNVVLSTTGKAAIQNAITAATGTNYNAATFEAANGTTFTITKAPLTATISSGTKAYDGAATVTTPTVAYTVLSGSMVAPTIAWDANDFEYLAADGTTVVSTPINAGSYTVQLSAVGQAKLTAAQATNGAAQNYTITPANGTYVVTAATATVNLDGTQTVSYTGSRQIPNFGNYTVTLSNGTAYVLKAGDIALVSGGTNVGSYNVQLTRTGLNNITAALIAATGGNYNNVTLGKSTGTFIITPADTTVTLSGNETETYNGNQQVPKASNYRVTLPTGVTYALKDSDIQLTSGGINTGTYDVVLSDTGKLAIQAAITAATGNGNYTVNFDLATAPFNILAAKTSAELSKTDFVYDGTTKASGSTELYATVAVNGGNSTVKVALSNADVDFVTDGTNADTYAYNLNSTGLATVNAALDGFTNGNYQLAATSDATTGLVTINKAKATIDITSNDNITYDGKTHSLVITVAGAVNGEIITYTPVNNSQTLVGQYTVTATADPNAVNSNYEIAEGMGSMTIVKAPTTPGEIVIGDANGENLNKTYNGKTFDGSPVVQGPEKDVTLTTADYEYLDANGDTLTDPINAGSYTIKLTQSGIDAVTAANSGYDLGDLSSLKNDATIHKAQAKINITSNDNITFDGNAHSLDIEVIGAVNGETITYTATNNSQTKVGQYDVSATADTNVVNNNYEVTVGTGSMTIVKAPTKPGEIIITDANGNDLDKTYDGKTFGEGPVVQGPENDVTLVTGNYEYLDTKGNVVTNPINVGDYTIKLTQSGINAVTVANSNYDLGDLSSLINDATINKAKATINIVSNDQITYDGNAHSLNVEVTGAVNGETITYIVDNNSHTAVGQYKVTATADDNDVNSNYNITVTDGSMTIVKATTPAGEISIGDANGYDLSKTYDGKTFTESSVIVVQGPEEDVTLTTGEYAYYDQDGNEVTDPVNAGSYTIKLTEAGIKAVTDANSGYELGDLSGLTNDATINKAQASINVTSNDKITYDGNAHSLEIEVTGAVNGETITYTVSNNSQSTVGQYDVTTTADTNAINSNYEITAGTGSMTIVKAPTKPGEISIGDANGNDLNKTYDGKTFIESPVVQGPEKDVTLATGDYEYLDADGKVVTEPLNAGNYTIKLTDAGIKAITDANSNYDLGDLSGLTNDATINKAKASINVVSNDKITYDGDAHSLVIEVTGAVNGEIIAYTTENNSQTTVGQYDVSTTATDNAVNSNYEITAGTGSMTIVKASTTPGEITVGDVKGNDLSKTYDGHSFNGSPVVQGPENDVTLESGDYAYFDAAGSVVTDPKNAGDYTIKLTESGIKAVTAANSNYDLGDLTTVVNKATINKATAMINVTSNDDITYDGVAHSLQIEVVGAVNGETISYTAENNSQTTVGQYDVSATADDNAVNSNYEIKAGSGSMTIVKAPTSPGEIIIGDANGAELIKTYDGKTFSGSPVLVVQGPENNVPLKTGEYAYYNKDGKEVTDPVNAGSYTIKLTEAGIAAVTAANSNYDLGDLTTLKNTATINKAPAKINIVSNDKITYDGNAHSLVIEVTGAVNGETITYTVENNSHTVVGQYDVKATAAVDAVNSNYDITVTNGSMTIEKAVTPSGEIHIGDANGDDLSKTYDGKSFSDSLVVQGPEKNVTLTAGEYAYYDKDGKEVTDPVNAGNYTIKLTEAGIQAVTNANSNYDLGDLKTLVNNATIQKAQASINITSDNNITYDGSSHSLKIEVTGAVNGETITYTVDNNSHTAVGQYNVTANGDGSLVNSNYEITNGKGSMTIVKAPTMPGEITIGDANGNDLSKTYDGKSFSSNPVVQGPEADVTLEAGEYAYYNQDGTEVTNPVNAGEYTINLTSSGVAKVKVANSNYELGDLTEVVNKATIQKAKASINITSDDNIMYDGSSHSLDIEVTGAVNGETITYTVDNNSHTAVGQYDVTANTDDSSVNSNYEITSGKGSMTIVKSPTKPGEIKIGDVNGEDLSKTYDGKTFSGSLVVQGPENDVILTTGEYAFHDKDGNEVTNPVNAGDYTIKLTKSGITAVTDANSNYDVGDLTEVVNKATIQKAKASINITSDNHVVYNGDAHSLKIEVTGAVNGETITYTTVNNSHTSVGQYDVTASADKDNAVNSNYEITAGSGSMTIVKAPTTPGEIIIGNANGNDLSKTYDGKTFGESPVVQGPEKDVILTSDEYEYLDVEGKVVTDPVNAGDYTIKLTEAGIKTVTDANSDYDLGDLSPLTNEATIRKAPAKINIVSNDNITYDGDTHSIDIEVTGAVYGETITYTAKNNSQITIGHYEVTASADDNEVNSNYEITPGKGSMTIVKAPTTGEITIGNADGEDLSKTYDGKTFSGNPVVQGPENDVILTTGEYVFYDKDGNEVKDPVNAGDYTIKLTESGITAVTNANNGYDLGDLSAIVNKATISKAKATLTVTSNDEITYDGKAHSLDVATEGAVNGETITYTTDHNSNTNVGQYDVTVTADKNDVNDNYDITVVKGSMTIIKATTPEGEISIGNAKGENLKKTYDGKSFGESPVVQGPEADVTLRDGDYEYFDANGNVVKDPTNAGDYTVKLTAAGIKAVADANSNYDLGDLTTLVNKATISKAKATLTVTSNDEITYDGEAHSLDVVTEGAVNGETITYTTGNNEHTTVGQYDVTVTADKNDVNSNYDITVTGGSMTIVKATTSDGKISIGDAQGDNLSKTYDGKTFADSPVVQGPENNVTLAVGDYAYYDKNGKEVTDPVNADDYQIKLTASGIDKVKSANSNYDLGDLTTLVSKATISKAQATLTVTSNDDITYNGQAHSLDVVTEGAVEGETITYTTGNNSHTNVGHYDVTVKADDNEVNSNYDITVSGGSMTIVKAGTTPGETTTQVKVNDASSNYGESSPDFTITIGSDLKNPGNLTNSDFVFVDKATGKEVDGVPINVGDYQVSLNDSGKAKVSAANPNYDLTDGDFISGTYTIKDIITHSKITVNQTVHYTGAGVRTPADKTQSIVYDVATSKATGESVYTPESGYAAVKTPDINGFTNSGDVAGYTPATTTNKPTDSTVTVTYKPTNNLEYSEITVTRTVHYEGAGKQTPHDVIENVVYKVVTNKTTGEVSYTPQGVYEAVATPDLSGYTNSGDVAESIPTATMNKPEDSLVVVQYKKISGGDGTNPGNPSNPGEGGNKPDNPGGNHKPGNGGTTPNVPTTPGTGSGSGKDTSGVSIDNVKYSNAKGKADKDIPVVKAGVLPQTDEQHENGASVIGMIILSGFLALFGLKRRKHDDEE